MVCFDAKINFDDNAKFRQRSIFEQEDTAESDPREVEAAKSDLNYIGMSGNIGCLGIPIHSPVTVSCVHCYSIVKGNLVSIMLVMIQVTLTF